MPVTSSLKRSKSRIREILLLIDQVIWGLEMPCQMYLPDNYPLVLPILTARNTMKQTSLSIKISAKIISSPPQSDHTWDHLCFGAWQFAFAPWELPALSLFSLHTCHSYSELFNLEHYILKARKQLNVHMSCQHYVFAFSLWPISLKKKQILSTRQFQPNYKWMKWHPRFLMSTTICHQEEETEETETAPAKKVEKEAQECFYSDMYFLINPNTL